MTGGCCAQRLLRSWALGQGLWLEMARGSGRTQGVSWAPQVPAGTRPLLLHAGSAGLQASSTNACWVAAPHPAQQACGGTGRAGAPRCVRLRRLSDFDKRGSGSGMRSLQSTVAGRALLWEERGGVAAA